MQIRSFSGGSSSAVLQMIKDELGPDAIILDTREQDGIITMTAATERNPVTRSAAFAPLGGQADRFQSASGILPAHGAGKYRDEGKRQQETGATAHAVVGNRDNGKDRSANGSASQRLASGLGTGDVPFPAGWQQWHEEWSSIKSHLLALMKPSLRFDQLAPRQRMALEFLQREGVDDTAVLRLFQGLQQDRDSSILGPLSDLVQVRTWGHKRWPQRIHVVSGPFGVGKTSVAVRMALALRKGAPGTRICVINADATRGNGRLMLRHYCDLSDFVYKEAASTVELVSAINSAEREGFDRIFIDLPGLARGRRLATLMVDAGLEGRTGEGIEDAAVHLVLPPHYGDMQLQSILERYRVPHAGGIIWTKLDEIEHYGQIVNVGVASGLPVTALSYGPGLGNSLAPARGTMLWRLLFTKELPVES